MLALLASYFLKHTRPGLHLRAVGESASTADAAGINVTKYKYLATCIGSMIAGLGGLYYVMDYACGVWSNNAFGDRGWLAIALVIFTIWRPNVSVLASILFGGFYILYLYIPTGTEPGHQGALQDAPLCGNAGGAHHRFPAEKAGGSAPRLSGSQLLPGRTLTRFHRLSDFGGPVFSLAAEQINQARPPEYSESRAFGIFGYYLTTTFS